MTDAAIKKEVERQLAIIREGVVDFYGEDELAMRLAQCLKKGPSSSHQTGDGPFVRRSSSWS